MDANHNGSDPVKTVIEDIYEALSEQDKLDFDLQCALFLKNIRGQRRRTAGIGEAGARELLGKLAIYLVMKSEQAEGEDIWGGLLPDAT